MLFKVSQVSPTVELVFTDVDDFINVYPSYHQAGDPVYANVMNSDWYVYGTQYRWETPYYYLKDDTVPVIQLIYSYNATEAERQAQYRAFKSITAVETRNRKLYLYTDVRPSTNFRIRYRILNKVDLAIPLNRHYGIGIGYQSNYDEVETQMTAFNPVTNSRITMTGLIPVAREYQAGILPGGVLARLKKLEAAYNTDFSKPYRIAGYPSATASASQTTYYADVSSVQAVPADTWYKDCEIWTVTDATDFITASHLFYQQRATSLNLEHVYTGNVTTFSYALAANSLLQNIVGLPLLDTHSTTDISYMFSDDSALERVDLGSCCLDKVDTVEGLFKNCTNLNYIDVSSIDFTKVVNASPIIDQPDIFTGVPDDCTIWVGGQEQYKAIHKKYPNLTGITYN